MSAIRDPFLWLVVLAAAALRLWGIDHGLPFVYNPDEANIVARSLSVARGLDPGYYLYPSFFFYVLFFVMGGLFVSGWLVGRYEGLREFQSRFFEDPTDFYLAGRLVGVLCALATLVLTYRLVDRHFGRTAARAAAVVIAFCYFHVRDAHYVKHDVPAALLVVLALTAIDRARERPTRASYLLAGVALGVGFATHYYLVFLAPVLLIVTRLRPFAGVLASGAASFVTFCLLSPYVVLRAETALEHMAANREVVVDRSLSSGNAFLPSLGLYVQFILEQGLGYALVVLIGAGFVMMRGRFALWGTFPAIFLLFLSYTFFAGRYLNPVLPCFAAASGVAVAGIERRVGAVAWLVLGLACLQPLYRSLQVDRLFAAPDTRTLARTWILENVSTGTAIALQSYSVPLPQSEESFRLSLEANDAVGEIEKQGKYASLLALAERRHESYQLFFFGRGDELDRIYVPYEALVDGLEPLKKLEVSYVVLREPARSPPPEVASLFERVRTHGTLRHRVDPGAETPYLDNEDWAPSSALHLKGPRVEIWSLDSE
ncbi:MAG TPA: glycosyltransferase family 39 protein [Vicinamibacteria bacterium]|nr:glycosyltransferase family 39 protein [Vicinamibacteria bacterium]